MTPLYDIFFQHYDDVVTTTYRIVKLQVIVILISNIILISDKYENAINKGEYVALFHLLKYSDKLYDNIVEKIQIEMINFMKVPGSLVFVATSEFSFRFIMYKLTTAVTAFLKAFLIESNNKNLDNKK